MIYFRSLGEKTCRDLRKIPITFFLIKILKSNLAEINLAAITGPHVELSFLGNFWEIDRPSVEEFLVSLIIKGKLSGKISQKRGLLIFERPKTFSGLKIPKFCEDVSRLAEKVAFI